MQESAQIQHWRDLRGITIVKNVGCILTMNVDLDVVQESTSRQRLGIIRNADIVIQDGLILRVGDRAGAEFESQALNIIDGRDCVVMPALVDASAAPLKLPQAGKELVFRSQGMSQTEIVKQGIGGLAARKSASMDSLERIDASLLRFAAHSRNQGIGYSAVKSSLIEFSSVVHDAWRALCVRSKDAESPVRFAPCFFGLRYGDHVTKGLSVFVDEMIAELPRIREICDSAVSRSVDVNVDRDHFTKEHADRWCAASLQYGFDVMITADQYSRSGGSELAFELARRLEQKRTRPKGGKPRVLSVTHALYSSDADLARLAACGVGVVLTPALQYFRSESQADFPKLRSAGVSVAIASGYDPLDCPLHNLWFSAFLALRDCGLSLPEVLGGLTREAAFAIGMEHQAGVIQPGRSAELLAFSGSEPEDFFNFPFGDHLQWTLRP